MRMLAVFCKGERLRHIGHLDLMRAMQRALRRSELPVSYSKGFNPHILLTFASALSTGAWGKREIMDVTLERDISSETFMEAMNAALPEDLRVLSARAIDDRHPALMAMVTAAEYTLTVMDDKVAASLAACKDGFLSQEAIITPRKTKSGVKDCDVKPLILALSVTGNQIPVSYTHLRAHETRSVGSEMCIRDSCLTPGASMPAARCRVC